MTVTVKGKTFAVKLIALLEVLNELTVVYADSRAISEIAADWEGAEVITATDAGVKTPYIGYERMKRIAREENNEIYIALTEVTSNG